MKKINDFETYGAPTARDKLKSAFSFLSNKAKVAAQKSATIARNVATNPQVRSAVSKALNNAGTISKNYFAYHSGYGGASNFRDPLVGIREKQYRAEQWDIFSNAYADATYQKRRTPRFIRGRY